MCGWISDSWSSGDVYPSVPLILLLLAAASSCAGPERSARAGSSVFWLTALIFGAVIAAGVGQINVKGLTQVSPKTDLRLIVVLMIPALAALLPNRGKTPIRYMAGVFVFAVLISVLVTGSLSLRVAENTAAPFRAWVEGLSLAGTVQRFEAVASVALTMGWFALLSFLLTAGGALMEAVADGGYRNGVWGMSLLIGLLVFADEWISYEIMVVGCSLLWLAVPKVSEIRNRKKYQKNLKIMLDKWRNW